MPPKKDGVSVEANELLTGFTDKECKLLAAAFLSSTGPDKYDYDLMSTLTKNTVGSLKKMWPPVKKKAMETHSSFAVFLGQAGAGIALNGDTKPAAAPKPATIKKRKTTDEEPGDANNDPEPTSAGNKSNGKKKTSVVKGRSRPKKQVKKEESSSDSENKVEFGEDTASKLNGQDVDNDA